MSVLQLYIAAVVVFVVGALVSGANATVGAPIVVVAVALVCWARFKGPTLSETVDDVNDGGDGGGN